MVGGLFVPLDSSPGLELSSHPLPVLQKCHITNSSLQTLWVQSLGEWALQWLVFTLRLFLP
jgi:hypothetical protein